LNGGQPHDYLNEAAATMHALVNEGKVRAVGQSAYSDVDFARAIPVLKPDILQSKASRGMPVNLDRGSVRPVHFRSSRIVAA